MCLFLVNLAIYGFVVSPADNRLARAEGRALAAEDLLDEARENLKAATRQHEKWKASNSQLKRFYEEVLPQNLRDAQTALSSLFDRVADGAGLVVESRTITADPERDSGLGKLSTTMVLSGRYEGIRRFLFEVETSGDFILIEELFVARVDQASQSLVLNLSASTYFWEGLEEES
tara:strand:- start:5197 stop:5721 length:525 start_codon:yes stop_codon:yes gene_type:complete